MPDPTTVSVSAKRSRVLIVDDDPTIRRIVAAVVRKMGHEIIISGNGRHAWETLQVDESIDVLVTDIEMPEMDGRELVANLRRHEALSDLPVVVVSGAVGPREIAQLLDLGASRFVAKPIKPARLISEIKHALSVVRAERERTPALVRKTPSRGVPIVTGEMPADPKLPDSVHRRIAELQALPGSLRDLSMLAANPDAEMDAVAKVVGSDPVLAAAVLADANRASAGGYEQITDLSLAVGRLGLRRVLAVGFQHCYSDETSAPIEGYQLDDGVLWVHSLRTALIAQRLVAHLPGSVPAGMAFTAGLFHEFGKLLLAPELASRYQSDPQTGAFLEFESNAAGCDHAIAGYALLQAWGLPEPILAAVRFHHKPSDAPVAHLALARAVHLADMIALTVGDPGGIDAMGYEIDVAAQSLLDHLDQSALDAMISQAESELATYQVPA